MTENASPFYIGTHLSVARGYARMGREALDIGASTLQFFARNPRGARAKQVNLADMQAFRQLAADNGFGPIVAHAPYTMNLCSPDPHLRGLSAEMLAEDLERMELLPGNLYNLHPGSSVGQPLDEAIEQIAAGLNRTLFSDMHTMVLLETMPGKGSEVGRSFEELRMILDRVAHTDKIGVCMDACHVWDAGYDIVDGLDGVLETFDRVIGLDRLYAFHINDSLNPCGSRKDRHARIGRGCIGQEALARLINHPALRSLPFILETPNDLAGHAEEIALLRRART